MTRQRKPVTVPAMVLATLVTVSVAPATAALPPYWQSVREIEAILNDQRVHDAFAREEPVIGVERQAPNVYEVSTPSCRLTVTLVAAPNETETLGPRSFDLDIGVARC